ncbi:hypothetical protein K435DRAFT_104713 [Dendrothele bispora CBS 962.96]|uniref:Uncharacterized protein n=1 Tax=Dendrothele bispora (strain CBS 962.96) TaxID=1314807 RepID=A0A4S8MQR3_DENBC|nr:hypothetical protein K435DRAFT_104713 [Dendrothele bispora CBS 962.96]
MSLPKIDRDKGKANAEATTSIHPHLSPIPAQSSHYSGIYSAPRVPSPLAQDMERRRMRLMSAPTSATSSPPKDAQERPATSSSLSKRKADDGEDGIHRKRATFAADTFEKPRQASGSSHVAGRKRPKLLGVESVVETDNTETRSISTTHTRNFGVGPNTSLSRNSTQRSRKISQPTSVAGSSRPGHVPRRNITSSHSRLSQTYSQYSRFSQSQSPHGSSSQLGLHNNPSTSRLSTASSIPVSALITPRAPSVSVSQHRSTNGGYHYHMSDPRKPPKVRPTSWGLTLPEGNQMQPRVNLFDLLRGRRGFFSGIKRRTGLADSGKTTEYSHDPESVVSRDGTSTSSGHRGWIEAGGSPVHAWLFFLGFVLFPLWWIGGFLVGIPRTRKLGEGEHEKGVVLDDPQVEHDALSWRTRCRVMAVISLFTYVPFIILVAILVPRNRG